jgi:hypothetical protein
LFALCLRQKFGSNLEASGGDSQRISAQLMIGMRRNKVNKISAFGDVGVEQRNSA